MLHCGMSGWFNNNSQDSQLSHNSQTVTVPPPCLWVTLNNLATEVTEQVYPEVTPEKYIVFPAGLHSLVGDSFSHVRQQRTCTLSITGKSRYMDGNGG